MNLSEKPKSAGNDQLRGRDLLGQAIPAAPALPALATATVNFTKIKD
jgi:hypothetical protein